MNNSERNINTFNKPVPSKVRLSANRFRKTELRVKNELAMTRHGPPSRQPFGAGWNPKQKKTATLCLHTFARAKYSARDQSRAGNQLTRYPQGPAAKHFGFYLLGKNVYAANKERAADAGARGQSPPNKKQKTTCSMPKHSCTWEMHCP